MRRKLKKIIVILCLFLVNINSISYGAVTLEQFGEAVVGFSYNFYKESGFQTAYILDSYYPGYNRSEAYQGRMVNGKWRFDCVGFVAFAIHHATGLGPDTFTDFAAPTGCAIWAKDGFEEHFGKPKIEDLQPGDVLQNSHHVMIFAGDIDKSGNNTIIHCDGWGGPGGPGNKTSQGWGVNCEYIQNYSDQNFTGFARVTDEALKSIDESDLSDKSIKIYGSGQRQKYTADMANFYYNGIPDGKYGVTKNIFEISIGKILDALKFLVFLLPNVIKMVFVGWTAIGEDLVDFTVRAISSEDNIESKTSDDIVDTSDNVTIEKILFNKINIFDINFFNYNEEKNN